MRKDLEDLKDKISAIYSNYYDKPDSFNRVMTNAFEFYEAVKEEPITQGTNDGLKSVITENKEKIKEQIHYSSFADKIGKFWSKQPLDKQPIDTNRVIIKEGASDINNDLIINDFNVTCHIREVCREEINKYEKSSGIERYEKHCDKKMVVKKSPLDDVYNMDVFEAMMKEQGLDIYGRNIKKKKEKQSFDGDKKIYINQDGTRFLSSESLKSVESESDYYHLATQAEINQFFKGSKKRNLYRYHKVIGNEKYHYIKEEIKTGYCNLITEQEYLKGLK